MAKLYQTILLADSSHTPLRDLLFFGLLNKSNLLEAFLRESCTHFSAPSLGLGLCFCAGVPRRMTLMHSCIWNIQEIIFNLWLQKSQYKDGIKNENDITSSDGMDIQTEKRTEWLKLITHLPHSLVGRISTKRPKWSPLCHLVFSPVMQNMEQWWKIWLQQFFDNWMIFALTHEGQLNLNKKSPL